MSTRAAKSVQVYVCVLLEFINKPVLEFSNSTFYVLSTPESHFRVTIRDGILRQLTIFLLVSDFVQFNISLRIMENNDD
jgi:hypothetical protein